MKAKKYLTLALAVGLIVLSACGGNTVTNETGEETNNVSTEDSKPGSDEDQKDEDGDSEPGDENIEDESRDFDTLAEEGFGIGFIPHGCDAEYFKPATEDYILTIEQTIVRENAIPAISQTGDLYSFDENGNCVQHVSRHRPDHEFEELTDFDIEHLTSLDYRSYEQQVLDDDYNNEAFGFEDTAFPNSESPAFDQLISFAERNGGGDYKIEILNGGEKKIGKVCDYWDAEIFWYDSEGKISKMLWIKAFDDPDSIELYLRDECATTNATYDLFEEQYEKINAKKNFMTDGSILYFDFYGTKVNEEPYTNGRKWQLLRSTNSVVFLSVPYLDDGQINAFYTEYDVLY